MPWRFQRYTWVMKPPLFIRPITDDERMPLEADRRTADACRVRRAQSVLASARGLSPHPIAPLGGGAVQTVRNLLHALNEQGVAGVARQSNRPKTIAPALDAAHGARLQHSWPPSPRLYATPTGVGTLGLAAAVCSEQGSTERGLSDASIRRALTRRQTHGQRAKHWSTSPDPHSGRKKRGALVCSPWRWGIPPGGWGSRRPWGGAATRSPLSRPGQTPNRCV
jgi:hypothetical protein